MLHSPVDIMLIPLAKHTLNRLLNDVNEHLTKCPFLAARWSDVLPVSISELLTNSSSDLKKTTCNIKENNIVLSNSRLTNFCIVSRSPSFAADLSSR